MYIRNIGRQDRNLRFLLAIVILLIVALMDFNLTLRWILGIFGVLLFITAVVNWCPLYSVTNHSSRGQGLDKITKRDIEEAVRSYSTKTEDKRVEIDIKPQTPKKKADVPKSATKAKVVPAKKSTKSVNKKTVSKKTAPKKAVAAKKATKSTVKKAPVKKDATATKKKAPVKKKAATKKKK